MSDENISFSNLGIIEQLYDQYLKDEGKADPGWRAYFESFQDEMLFEESSKPSEIPLDFKIHQLINAYRTYGHLRAKVNPLTKEGGDSTPQLSLDKLGFAEEDLERIFPSCGILKKDRSTLKEIVEALDMTYCGSIGVEYMGLQSPRMEKWLQLEIEPNRFKAQLSIDQKRNILENLNKSELLEVFLHTKYTGQKRFSLEGGETLIPMMRALLDTGADLGAATFVVGMAHRGRLNVLCNIMNKSYEEVFSEFQEGYVPESYEGSGDVKYHKGFSSEVKTSGGQTVKIKLSPNPSHLESVNPVVEGICRAMQDHSGREEAKRQIVPVLIHGDAAIAGQGVVYETLQMYKLPGYQTGGTVHLVINNQIGFTAHAYETRSTTYCTDIACAFGAPVFHVNAEDPEACVLATQLAMKMREKFSVDVFIDLICYRKYGHNETDEPAFTQPLEYRRIRKKRPIREIYRDDLVRQGVLEKQAAESLERKFKDDLYSALSMAQQKEHGKAQLDTSLQKRKKGEHVFDIVDTKVERKTLIELAKKITHVPDAFNLHKKLQGLVKERREQIVRDLPIDWGMGELMAYASILNEGRWVRLSGQDTARGTFSHRHAMWRDQENDSAYYSESRVGKGRFVVINSLLSEYAAMGFELGYSIAAPLDLVIWEAQFGDFANGAQIIIDQYLATSEEKWGQPLGLTLFLPHGYEGQGPEHSSGRIERFLTLCGDKNMRVTQPTSPSQLFHLLRRQTFSKNVKPLIIFTPKALLRHPQCTSCLKDLAEGSFHEILDDPDAPKKPKKLILCSGKIYYDLIKERKERKAKELAIIRIEQIYPFHRERLKEILQKYQSEAVIWCQDEPNNMGAWDFVRPRIRTSLLENQTLYYIGRARRASPATGSHALHKAEQKGIIEAVFDKSIDEVFAKAYYCNI